MATFCLETLGMMHNFVFGSQQEHQYKLRHIHLTDKLSQVIKATLKLMIDFRFCPKKCNIDRFTNREGRKVTFFDTKLALDFISVAQITVVIQARPWGAATSTFTFKNFVLNSIDQLDNLILRVTKC